jgi:hypothetical protein
MIHPFIFNPGAWEGEGSITFSMAEDVLHFTTRWVVLPVEAGKIYFSQEVEINSLTEKMRNQFTLFPISKGSFEIQLENQIVGKVVGSGLVTPEAIAWEFRKRDQQFEGYEIYQLQKDGSYKMRAEFTAGDQMRTQILGSISPLSP